MIAKLVVWDRDRPAALRRLRGALEQVQVAGLTTNLAFLAAAAAHPAFVLGGVDTGFIDRHRDELVPDAAPASARVLAVACLDVLLRRQAAVEAAARESHDPYAPWNAMEGWRINDEGHDELRFIDGGDEVAITVRFRAGGYALELPGGTVTARGELADGGGLKADLDGVRLSAAVVHEGRDLTVVIQGATHRLTVHEILDDIEAAEATGAAVTAPMPGKIIEHLVEAGAQVERGAALLILEAMKMEHTIVAPTAGTLTAFHYQPGEQVDEGAELFAFEPRSGG